MTREQLINHILIMKKQDEIYARWALQNYNRILPDMKLNDGVREAMKAGK